MHLPEKYAGYTRKKVQDGVYHKWDKTKKEYVYADKTGKTAKRFTYFAARGFGLPKETYGQTTFFSNVEFRQQVWLAGGRRVSGKRLDAGNLGLRYGGKIPLPKLIALLSRRLNIDGGKDFRKVYRNWDYRYETGWLVKTEGGLVVLLDRGMPKRDRKGAPEQTGSP